METKLDRNLKIQNLIFLCLIIIFTALTLIDCQTKKGPIEAITYPVTDKVEVVDNYFGTLVPDPYRWMENENDPRLRPWIEAQNRLTFSYLEKIPFREAIRRRLLELYSYERFGLPIKAGRYHFYTYNEGLMNQPYIMRQEGLRGEATIFMDVNKLSIDGTTRANLIGFSQDNSLVAVAISEAGSDWTQIRVWDVNRMEPLTDNLKWIKFSRAGWFGRGFFYSGFDEPEPGKELSAQNAYQKIFYHRVGDPQEKDILIYEDKAHPFRYHQVSVTEDEKYLILYVTEGTHGNEIYYKELTGLPSGPERGQIASAKNLALKIPSWKKSDRAADVAKSAPEIFGFKPLLTGFEANAEVIDVVDGHFLVLTDKGAPKWRVVKIDPADPSPDKWVDLIPQMEKETIQNVQLVGGKLFVVTLKDVASRVYQYNLQGELEKEIPLPTYGTVSGFTGRRHDPYTFFSFTSFTYPTTIYLYDLSTGQAEPYFTPKRKPQFKPEDYECRQVFYSSKDGTRIPMFIVHKKGLKKNGQNPTYLYGYGGFNISLTPTFNINQLILLENGGIYAVANLRGGGEYGEEWHRAGMLLNKQNVFDDFIAAAEYLIKEKYTSPDYLAIAGASNGGLLVGAAMTQRPELFKVAFPSVGVMDMLRFHKFTVGWGWVVEYGSSDDPVHFKNLFSYSPLHNLKEGISYPATLVMTADHDDRVVPAHSFKFIATLQEKHRGLNPVLIRIETRSGHGASSTMKAVDQMADVWAFMFHNMGIKPKYKSK
ncbi:MAG: prolyl oligopeptidase family serine peptidase [Candidatus Aminicenantes bacterium]|nr:prolyl oligopeptidase family serine peptidase [Candidatus Aminicenantes bacterium]